MYFEVLLDKFLVDMLPQVKTEFTLKRFKLLRLILKILPVSLALNSYDYSGYIENHQPEFNFDL